MTIKKSKELMMVSLTKAVELYLSTLATEGKSPRYIAWLDTRLRFFTDFMKLTHGEDFKVNDLTLEDGREYIKHLMERDSLYKNHPIGYFCDRRPPGMGDWVFD